MAGVQQNETERDDLLLGSSWPVVRLNRTQRGLLLGSDFADGPTELSRER